MASSLLCFSKLSETIHLLIPKSFLVKYIEIVVCSSLARQCVFGEEDTLAAGSTGKNGSSPENSKEGSSSSSSDIDVEAGTGLTRKETMMKSAMQLLFCVAGLQGSYLTWGVLQEMIMTRSYGTDEDGNEIRFTNSQYLVFINRILAFIAAYIVCRMTTQPRHTAPLYRYSFASMSNIMSSWCQYEALKYVSFPTQVLAKSSKIIPVMIMGKYVQSKTYPAYEYVCAAILSLGVSLFLFAKAEDEGKLDTTNQQNTSLMGLLLLVGYMAFDRYEYHVILSF